MKLFIPLLDNGDGSVRAKFMQAFINAFAGTEVHLVHMSDSHPGRGRNRAAAMFLKTDCTHLLFIDADIIFTAADIKRLNESAEAILAGLYPKKVAERTEWCINPLPENQGTWVKAGDVFEIKRAGTGFLRISREAFEKLKPFSSEYDNHGERQWDFFESGVREREWLSEDWYFCDKARSAGLRIMAHSAIQLRHEGSFVYPAAIDRLKLCPPEMREHIERIWQGEYHIPMTFKTVLDIGGNIGGFAMWAKEMWPECTVESYEPHPDNVSLFKQNLKGVPGVNVFQYAVKEESGEFELVEGMNCGEHSFHFPSLGDAPTVKVLAVAAAILPSAELIKIDAEGSELEILRNLNLQGNRAIVLEYHSESDRKAIRELLDATAYLEYQHEEVVPGRGILKFIRS